MRQLGAAVKLGWLSLGLSAISIIGIGVITGHYGLGAVVRVLTDARYAQEAWFCPFCAVALGAAGIYLVRQGKVGLPVYVAYGAVAAYLTWLNLPFGAIVGIVMAYGLATLGKDDA